MRTLILITAAMLAAHAMAAEDPLEQAKKRVKPLGNNRVKLGDITIDKNANSIRFPAKINMTEGLLELLLCAPHGKTHESILVTKVEAEDLNLALILIGCKKGKVKVKEQGEDVVPDGTPLKIELEYKENGAAKLIPVENWIYNKKADHQMQPTKWVYTGSFFDEGEYMAKVTGTYIVTFHDSFTIIDLPLREAADDTIFWVNEKTVKGKDLPVELIITKLEEEKKEVEKEAD